jgi:RNA polymerase sigma factor (sigma-70 family)
MAPTSLGPLLRHLRKVIDPSPAPGVSDGELLERFVRRRDEVAFELLVWRHGRMVLAVCRRVLGDAHDAEDAFQAAFLALARKAASVRRHRSVAAWLHTVAHRVALRARKAAARRAAVALGLADVEPPRGPAEDALRRDLAAVLDEEVSRLPGTYRAAVVLCYLEGKTYREAARQLGLSVGTLSARLTRARALLRKRLVHRGVGVSGAVLAALLGEQAASAAPAALVNAAVKVATSAAAAPAVTALAEGALRGLSPGTLKAAAAVLLAGLLATGLGLLIPAAAPVLPAEPPERPPAALADKEGPARVDRHGDPLPPGALFRFGSVRMRYAGVIRNSALSPDGKTLATAAPGSVALWDLAAGKPLRRFPCGRFDQFCTPGLAFSPDGTHLGYVHGNDFACLWDVKSGKEVARFAGRLRHGHALCQFTPDGEEFVLNDGPKRVVFWGVRANKEKRSLPLEHVSLLSPDARFCVRLGPDRALTFHDARTGKEAGRLAVEAALDGIENGVAFAPDGKALAVVDRHKEVQVRDFPGAGLRFSFPLPDSAKYIVDGRDYWEYRLQFTADGRELLLGTRAGLVHRWDLATRKELPPLKKHVGAAGGAHKLPDGKTLVTTGADGLIRRWDWQTGRELSAPAGYAGRVHAAYSPDGRLAAVGDGRGRLDLWDTRTGRPLRTLQGEGPAVSKLAFTPDGKSLAAALGDSTVHFWAVPAGQEQRALRCGQEQNLSHLWAMRFSPDGRRLLVADSRYQARLWDLATGAVSWRGGFGARAFTADGKTVVSESGPYLRFLDAAGGKARAKVRLNTGTPDNLGIIAAITASPDGRRLAVGLHNGAVYLCDAHTGDEILHFQATDPPAREGLDVMWWERVAAHVYGLAFSADGKWLCTSGADGSVRLWEVCTGGEVLRLTGHEGDATEVSFGADSRSALTCGADAQAYLWSLRPPPKGGARPSLDSLWAALADEPKNAYRAAWALSEREGAPAFLRGKIGPAQRVADERLRKLIADLESEQFPVREAATQALAELDEVAVPAMRRALAGQPPPETRKRLERLVRRVETKPLVGGRLRTWRAVDVLERQGTAPAREVLKALAAGAPGALPTTAAQAALKRLGQSRTASAP